MSQLPGALPKGSRMTLETDPKLVTGLMLVALLIGALMLFPPPGLSPEAMLAAVLALFVIIFWAIESLSGHLTALAFFLLAVVGGVSPEVVFSGFKSGGVWLAFSGLVIASARLSLLS